MKQLVKPLFLATTLLIASTTMAADTGWNIGASIGASELRDESGDCDDTLSCDTSDVGYKVSAGYSFMPNFAIELAYVDLGEAKFDEGEGNSLSLSETGFAAYGIGIYPVDNFSLFAKAGFSNLKTKADININTIDPAFTFNGSASSSNTNFAWGIGAGYNFTSNISAGLEWERFKGEFSQLGASLTRDVDLFSVSAKYHF